MNRLSDLVLYLYIPIHVGHSNLHESHSSFHKNKTSISPFLSLSISETVTEDRSNPERRRQREEREIDD